MSRLAREHPEDERYQTLEGQRDALTERVDSAERCEVCDGFGRVELSYGRGWVDCLKCDGKGKVR